MFSSPSFLAASLSALLLASAAFAAEPLQHAAAFQAVLDCRAVADNQARLACYDAATSRMASAEIHGEIVVIDKQQAREAHRQAFGLNIPSIDVITHGLTGDETNQSEGKVRAASADASGRWTVILDDGAVWRQISDEILARDPHPGSKVLIHRASMGSFMMSVDGRPAIRVHRDQ